MDQKMSQMNRFKVHKNKWRKWSIIARGTFNKTYEVMKENPGLFRHPKDPVVSKRFTGTNAWNAAWIAADHVDETLREVANG
jgi:hypothetical protein